MAGRVAEFEVGGPRSLETSRQFWEGFTPAALAGEATGPELRTVFCAEGVTATWCWLATVILMQPRRRHRGQ